MEHRLKKRRAANRGHVPSLQLRAALRAYFQSFSKHCASKVKIEACGKEVSYIARSSSAGFTLVEMLVAVSIFAIVMTISVGTLIVLLSAGAVAQSSQSITSNLSFAIDTIARHIRTGYDYYCTSTVPGNNSALPAGTRDCASGAVVFIFTEGETEDRTAYWFDSTTKALYQKVESGSWIRLTSEDIAIDPFVFILVGSTGGDSTQPTVRITLKAQPIETRADLYPFYIQTTVTSKQLNI